MSALCSGLATSKTTSSIFAGFGGKSREAVASDRVTQAALERFLEIVSEASRHLPEEWKSSYGPEIDWRGVADIGNVLRHVYDQANLAVLRVVYTDHLDPLERAVDEMLTAHPIDL